MPKPGLLHKVNHRVKNNLSTIVGLLYAERRRARAEDQFAYQSITENLINRVQGLAIVHGLLSVSRKRYCSWSGTAWGLI